MGIDLGYLCSSDSLYAAWQVSQNRGDGEIVPLFGHGLYQPKTILGINARSQNTAVARQFLATAPVGRGPGLRGGDRDAGERRRF